MNILKYAALGFILSVGPLVADPSFWRHEWPQTDFSTTSLDSWNDIRDGGPGKDGIPALSAPKFHDIQNETALEPSEAVISVALEGAAPRAYPIRYLMWHEIVNDTLAGQPIAVTYCPLCNSAMVFDRSTENGPLDFGVTGKLRHSDMVMYDRQTQSWWQQATGTGIVGHFTDHTLRQLPSVMQSWAQFKEAHPEGRVMRQPDLPRSYGQNPYVGYDQSSRPFLFQGEFPPHDIPPLMRVLRVGDRAWPLDRLSRAGTLTEAGVTITWAAGQASPLEARQIGQGRDIGTLTVTDQTGAPVPHDLLFAFAFHAFWPDGTWMLDPT